MARIDYGAGTAAAFGQTREVPREGLAEWRDALRRHLDPRPGMTVLDAGAVWLSTVLHHIPDLGTAAHEFRRVLRPGGSVLIRNVFPGRVDRLGLVRWFPEITRTIATYPTVERTQRAFAGAGFTATALEPVRQTAPTGAAGLLARLDDLRTADTLVRGLTQQEFARGRERIKRATARRDPEASASWLDLLVLRAGPD